MTDTYHTITNQIGEGYYTEKRSKFLAFAHHVETVDEVKELIAAEPTTTGSPVQRPASPFSDKSTRTS